jgi:hypothetical protein
MTRYRVILSNSAGELDSFTSTDLDTAREELACLLCSGSWVLAAYDTIRVVEQVAGWDLLPKTGAV